MVEDLLSHAEEKRRAYEYDAAETLYRTYLKTHQTDAPAWNTFGLLLLDMHNPTEAAEALGNAFDLQPENPAYATDLGNALAYLHSFEDAKLLFERAAEHIVQLYPKLRAADMLLSCNKTDAGISCLQQLSIAYPNEPDIYQRLFQVYQKTDRRQDAFLARTRETQLRKSAAEKVNGSGEWLAYGVLCLEDAAYAEAKSAFTTSLEREPSALTHLYLAQVFVKTGKIEEARKEIAAGLSIEGHNLNFVLEVADTLTDLGQYEDAICAYTKALELRNIRADTWASLAYALLQTGKPDDARAFFEMAKATATVRELKWADKLHKTDKTAALDKAFGT